MPELGLSAGGRNFRFEKTLFSMLTDEVCLRRWAPSEPEVRSGPVQVSAKLRELGKRTLLLWGMETHVCVQQTALDALAQGYQVCPPIHWPLGSEGIPSPWKVVLVADGCASRTGLDKDLALGRLRSAGVIVTSHESLLFQVSLTFLRLCQAEWHQPPASGSH